MTRPFATHGGGVSPLPEHARNALLRRVDWRFLLTNPRPTRTVCFATGALADAVALISDVVVPGDREPLMDCDLAVVVNPDATTLRDAWNALQPGGSIYIEWRSCVRGPGPAARRLRRVGFRDVLSYWPYPNPAKYRPQLWVPLESPGAVQYFLHRDPGLGRVGFVLRRLARSLRARLTGRDAWSMCTTATKPPLDESPTSDAATPGHAPLERTLRTGIVQTIRDRWAEWGLGPPPGELTWLLMARGTHSSNKVVAAVIEEAHPTPRVAVKMARTPEGAAAVQREARNLEALASKRGQLDGFPQALFCQRHAGILVLAETFIPGRPMASHLNRRTFPDFVLRGADWLAALAAPAGCAASPSQWKAMLDHMLEKFEFSFGAVLDRTLLRQTHTVLAALQPLPVVFEHRDYSPTNIIITASGELGVLDWESAKPAGIPFLDLIYFVTNAAFIVDGVWGSGPYLDSYRQTWDPATRAGAVVHQAFTRYQRATGLEPHDLSSLRLLAWLIHSQSEYQRMMATSGGVPTKPELLKSAFVSLWKEELLRRDPGARARDGTMTRDHSFAMDPDRSARG